MRDIHKGEPGTTWTNTSDKCFYQFHANWQNTCGVCAQFDGLISHSWAIPYHFGCRCRQSLIAPGGTSRPFTDFRETIAKLDRSQQNKVMGASNLKLVEKGVVGYSDVVTTGRVRDFREVVSLKNLSLKTLADAGVNKRIAEDAHRTVHTAAHEIADESRNRIAAALKARGISDARARRMVGERLAGRVTVGAGPGGAGGPMPPPRGGPGPQPPPRPGPRQPTPTPPSLPTPAAPVKPLTGEEIEKHLGIRLKPAPGPRKPFVPAKTVREAEETAKALGTIVAHRTGDVLELMAERYGAAHGWTGGKTKDGFVKNWKKRIKGSEPDPEVLLEALNGVNSAVHSGKAAPWPTVIRKPIEDNNEDFIAGRYMPHEDYLVIYDNGDAKKNHEPSDITKRLIDVPSAYASDWEGTYVHEYGHHYTIRDRPEIVKRAADRLRDMTPETKSRIKDLVSNYATSNDLELAAEAYTLSRHPEFNRRSRESQEFVREILGE